MSSSSSQEYFSAEDSIRFTASSQDESSQESMMSDLLGLEPYRFEPLGSSPSGTGSMSSSSGDNSADSSQDQGRVGTTSWCLCGNCRAMESENDCVCCAEVHEIIPKRQGISCVVDNPDFQSLCISRPALRNVLTLLHYVRYDPLEENPSNQSMRFAGYRQFTCWIHQRLGRGNRKTIPSCVLWKIRDEFPSEDGTYVAFTL